MLYRSTKNTEYIVCVIIIRPYNNNQQRFYVHEALAIKKDELLFKTGASLQESRKPSNNSSSIFSILQEIVESNNFQEKKEISSNSNSHYEDTLNNIVKNSTKNSEGLELTKEQQEYFKDSKARDKDGNLLVLYHGTPEGGFTVFDSSQSYIADKPSVANWFSTNTDMINKYYNTDNSLAPNKKQLYSVYLNITNPLEIDAHGDAWNEIHLPQELQGKGINKYYNWLEKKTIDSDFVSTDLNDPPKMLYRST